jgi:putative transposase
MGHQSGTVTATSGHSRALHPGWRAGTLFQVSRFRHRPAEHHKRIRHSNFIERTFGETRRRTKVIGRLPGETSCLTPLGAVLDRASRGWRGVNTTPDGLRLLHDLRRCLLEPPPQIHPRTPATDSAAENVRATA